MFNVKQSRQIFHHQVLFCATNAINMHFYNVGIDLIKPDRYARTSTFLFSFSHFEVTAFGTLTFQIEFVRISAIVFCLHSVNAIFENVHNLSPSSLKFPSNEKASNSKVSFVRLVSEKSCQNATS